MALGAVNKVLKYTRTTTSQDPNGNPIPSVVEWQTRAEYKTLSVESLMYAGLPTDLTVIRVKYRYHPDRAIFGGGTIEFMGKTWQPEGPTKPDKEHRPQWWIQILKHG